MCNSSFHLMNSSSIFEESLSWYCICGGYFGPPLLVVASALCFVVGTPVHCWTLWVSLHGTVKPNRVFPLNITIVELLFCVQCIIDLIDVKYPTAIGYRIANFLIGLSWTVRPVMQTCMSIEQYVAVVRPVTFLRYKNIHSRTALASAAWFLAVGNSFRQLFLRIDYFRDHVLFVLFCTGVFIVSFCCVSVLWALRRPGPGDRNTPEVTEKDGHNKPDRVKTGENQQKRKAFKKIVHILMSILICYVPLVVVYFLNVSEVNKLFYTCEAAPLLVSFTMVTVLLSPIITIHHENRLTFTCFKTYR